MLPQLPQAAVHMTSDYSLTLYQTEIFGLHTIRQAAILKFKI